MSDKTWNALQEKIVAEGSRLDISWLEVRDTVEQYLECGSLTPEQAFIMAYRVKPLPRDEWGAVDELLNTKKVQVALYVGFFCLTAIFGAFYANAVQPDSGMDQVGWICTIITGIATTFFIGGLNKEEKRALLPALFAVAIAVLLGALWLCFWMGVAMVIGVLVSSAIGLVAKLFSK